MCVTRIVGRKLMCCVFRSRHAAGLARGLRDRQEDRRRRNADLQRPLQSKPPGPSPAVPEGEAPEQRIARLEAENAALRAETTKLTTEREILQRAAKYFAGETRW